jgi:archaemetzincin
MWLLAMVAQGQSAADAPLRAGRAEVALVTLGAFPEPLVGAIASGLASELQVVVERRPARPLPRGAYYPPRRRYRAERLLDHLRRLLVGEPRTTRVIGFTSVDISTTKGRHRDWGVFGLGDLDGRASVISTFRLRRGARDDAHFRFRVVTTAVHEVGHTLGLPHCTEARCVMNDAHGSIRTVDTSTGRLGPGCRRRLEASAPVVPLPNAN